MNVSTETKAMKTNLGRTDGGNTHNICGIKQITTIRGGKVSESQHRSHISVVATLVLLVHQIAKRSHPFTDEDSDHSGVSSKENSRMHRRHLDATSPVIPMRKHRETICSQKKMMT